MTFFGKYRGKVVDNIDPMNLGRLRVKVPAIYGDDDLNWAMPCSPFAGKNIGFFALPPVGSNVWVEFEAGNPDCPIWSGGFWGQDELPADPATEENKVFKTAGISMKLSDLKNGGGFILEVGSPSVSTPLKVELNSEGIKITDNTSSIKITSDGIELDRPSGNIKMTQDGIQIAYSPGSIKLTSSAVELCNGASSVKLSSSSVNVNNGALEVT